MNISFFFKVSLTNDYDLEVLESSDISLEFIAIIYLSYYYLTCFALLLRRSGLHSLTKISSAATDDSAASLFIEYLRHVLQDPVGHLSSDSSLFRPLALNPGERQSSP